MDVKEIGGASTQSARLMQHECPLAFDFFVKRNVPTLTTEIRNSVAFVRAAKTAGVWAMYEKESLVLQEIVGSTLNSLLQHYILDALRIEEPEGCV